MSSINTGFGRRPKGVPLDEWNLAKTIRAEALKIEKAAAARKSGDRKKYVGEREEFVRTFFARLGRAGRIATHEYKNGDFDAELLWRLKRGVQVQDLFDLVQAAFEKPFHHGWFVQAGARYLLKDGDPTYKKVSGGLNEIASHWQRANRSNVAETILILLEKIGPRAQKRFRRKPVNVFIRLRNTEDRPTRDVRHVRNRKVKK